MTSRNELPLAAALSLVLLTTATIPLSTDVASATKHACWYYAPGNLIPDTGKPSDERLGDGTKLNELDWGEPHGLNPIPGARGIAQSQVYNPGGYNTPGDECDASNFSGPDRDNYCELRIGKDRWAIGCKPGPTHAGLDIKAGTRDDCLLMRIAQERILNNGEDPKIADLVAVQAVQDGVITTIGTFSVDLVSMGRLYRYMHINMKTIQVKLGDSVNKGKILGYMYDDYNKSEGYWTTFHLHWEIRFPMNGEEVFLPPYMAFIRSKERTLNATCQLVQ
ncbi:M23 family metallopeptidase [Mesorhizobium onobrychidis]|uniref:M23 family metallopeptidase n=1 Tax=Mesorhizobium onobrychidis TaxID=2775404 RepID=A0ABY5R1D2_9HYPH|nr:M23 family metallopeptidase [Mesorhizobium onobrychidis]UVC17281.1 M23 family metallopeptidase [Mesorhizobium onobrychidis]